MAAEGTSVQISIMTTTLLCRRIYMGMEMDNHVSDTLKDCPRTD